MKKLLVALLALALLASSVFANGAAEKSSASASSDEPVTIEVWYAQMIGLFMTSFVRNST